MNNEKSKKELVKVLLKNQRLLDNFGEEELIEMLVDENIALDVDKDEELKAKKSEILSDKFTDFTGSWTFILLFILFLIIWIVANLYYIEADPYPFILLNLLLSCVAALQAPIIMMSQKRQAKKDSLRSMQDYKTDLKSELILEQLHDHIEELLKNQRKLEKMLFEKNEKK